MAFERPTLPELIDRTKSDMESRLTSITGGGSLLRRAFARVVARVLAGGMHLVYGFLAFIAKQIIPDTAEGTYLRRWSNVWGVGAKTATYTTFNAVFTGTDGTSIPLADSSQLVRADGVLYAPLASAVISGGTATIAYQALDSGVTPNVEGGEILQLSQPIAGVSSSVTVSGTGIIDGVAAESDASLLSRLLDRIRRPPKGGSKNDYKQWTLEVAGVTRVWPYPLWLGDGTVGVTFTVDDDPGSIIPDPAKVAEVQAYIDDDSRRPVTADVTVFAPTPAPLNFTISGIASAAVRQAVQAELVDLIRREAEPDSTLLLSHIQEAISRAQGEVDHVLVSPTANVTTSPGVLTTMGTITWL